MSNLDKQTIFEAWLGQHMTPEQRQRFESLCIQDSDFAAQVQSINIVSDIAQQQQQLAPPAWDKDSYFAPPQKTRWWQWQGLPVASMALSIAAMLMVITGFNIEYSQDRLSIGFGKAIDDDKINLIVQQKMADLQSANAQVFNQYLDALKDQQVSINSQLSEYVLTSNRQQRREDFAELFKLINQQRYDDQVYFARQLNDLQDEINLKTGTAINSVRPVTEVSVDE